MSKNTVFQCKIAIRTAIGDFVKEIAKRGVYAKYAIFGSTALIFRTHILDRFSMRGVFFDPQLTI